MGLCLHKQQKNILLLGTNTSRILEFYNKIYHSGNDLSYKYLFSNTYNQYDNSYDIIIYFLDITINIKYEDTILLSKLSKNKKIPIYIFLNTTTLNFTLNINDIERIINFITNNYNLFNNNNIKFIEYLDIMTKNDILNIINF